MARRRNVPNEYLALVLTSLRYGLTAAIADADRSLPSLAREQLLDRSRAFVSAFPQSTAPVGWDLELGQLRRGADDG
jgi:hypothetical protein